MDAADSKTPRGEAEYSIDCSGRVLASLRCDDEETLVLQVLPADGKGAALVRTPHGNVSYCSSGGLSERRAADLARRFAERVRAGEIACLFPHLAAEPPPTGPTRDELPFDAYGVAELLQPELTQGDSAFEDFCLRSITDMGADACFLQFEHVSAPISLTVSIDRARSDGISLGGSLVLQLQSVNGEFERPVGEPGAHFFSVLAALLRRKNAGIRLTGPRSISVSEEPIPLSPPNATAPTLPSGDEHRGSSVASKLDEPPQAPLRPSYRPESPATGSIGSTRQAALFSSQGTPNASGSPSRPPFACGLTSSDSHPELAPHLYAVHASGFSVMRGVLNESDVKDLTAAVDRALARSLELAAANDGSGRRLAIREDEIPSYVLNM